MSEKIIALLGETASGKTDLAKRLVRRFPLEAVSIDSRQVFRDIKIGTAKDLTFKQHLIDVLEPGEAISAGQFAKLALKVVSEIHARGRTPLLVGGSGFYLDPIIYHNAIPAVEPSKRFRQRKEKVSLEKLLAELEIKDPKSALRVGRNRKRLIRALEIIEQTGRPIEKRPKKLRFKTRLLGLSLSPEILDRRINSRFENWLKEGLVEETARLRNVVSDHWIAEQLGLHYRFVLDFLDHQISREEMVERSKSSLRRLARKQTSWLSRYGPSLKTLGSPSEAFDRIESFLDSD